jgi:macrolide-specific efflux system membrane fusion protein
VVDGADAQRDLELAEDDLDAAEESLDRAETDAETETAEDAVDEAEAAVEEAEDAVDGTVLTAPADGTVIAVNGTVGGSSGGSSSSSGGSDSMGGETESTDSSSSSDGFIQIADLTDLRVTAAVAEADAADVAVGQTGTVTWNAIDATSGAELTAVAPTAGSSGNVATYDVTLTLDELPEQVRLGQTVTVAITVEEVADVLTVPTAAVEISGDTGTVTLIGDDGAQTEATVQIGLEGDSSVEIASGLAEGDTVALVVTDEEDSGTGEMQFPGGGTFPGGSGGQAPGSGGFPGGNG